MGEQRSFHYADDKSDKFWNITLDGSGYSIHFGRVGTQGQNQSKSFGSADEARSACEKIIAEKIKKGYVEQGAGAGASAAAASKPATAPKAAAPAARKPSAKSAPAPADMPPTPEPTVPPKPVSLENVIHLEPIDRARVLYGGDYPLPMTEEKPFDLEDCLQRLQKILPGGYQLGWRGAGLHTTMSRKEAQFWLVAKQTLEDDNLKKITDEKVGIFRETYALEKTAEVLSGRTFDGVVGVNEAGQILFDLFYYQGDSMPLLFSRLFSVEEYVDFTLNLSGPPKKMFLRPMIRGALVVGFHEYIAPWLTASQRQRIRSIVEPLWINNLQQTANDPVIFQIGAMAGMTDRTRALLDLVPVDHLKRPRDHEQAFLFIISNLGSRAEVEAQADRLGLRLPTLETIRVWLAHTGTDRLDLISKSVCEMTNKKETEERIREIAKIIEGPALAPEMLRMAIESRGQVAARKWLEEHPEWTLAGLEATAREKGKLGDEARRMIEMIQRQRQSQIQKTAAAASSAVVTEIAAIQPIPMLDATRIPRSLKLEPLDSLWVTYQEHEPLAKPEARPFDVEELIRHADSIQFFDIWRIDWSKCGLTGGMNAMEAEFWLVAAALPRELKTVADKKNALRNHTFTGLIKVDDLYNNLRSIRKPILAPLWAIYGAEEFAQALDLLIKHLSPLDIHRGFMEYVLPWLTAAEKDALRAVIAPRLVKFQNCEKIPQPPELTKNPLTTPVRETPGLVSWAWSLAAALGMHEQVRTLVESWPPEVTKVRIQGILYKKDIARRPLVEIILGLGSRELVEKHADRVDMYVWTPLQARAWMAHTGCDRLDVIARTLREQLDKEEIKGLFDTLKRAEAPETACQMFELLSVSRVAGEARAWLDAHPRLTAAGLLPIAAKDDKRGRDAMTFLRKLAASEAGVEEIKAVLDLYEPAQVEGLRAAIFYDDTVEIRALESTGVAPRWLAEAVVHAQKSKLPGWVQPWALPQLKLGSHTLSEQETAGALWSLAQSTLEAPAELAAILRRHGNTAANDAFAWELFEQWMRAGAPAKEKWALFAVGLLGGDRSAIELAKLVRKWPGESQHSRAVIGLECLRMIGSDTALMQINGIATKVQFKALKERANECILEIARERRMSREELEDRIVPDCGLGERGERIFDFGARCFRFVLSPEMKPLVREGDGKLKPDLPKPTQKDDTEQAEEAVDQWRLIKKQVREVAKLQAWRLEQAMVTGRRWTPQEFERLLLNHPLMIHLVRLLIWGGYDGAGKLDFSFRIGEDLEATDAADEATKFTRAARIGIVHPLELDEPARQAWGQVLGDYEIIPPFPQLGREIYTLTKEEAAAAEITRFAKTTIPTVALVHTLDRFGWQRQSIEDGGSFNSHYKPFPALGLTAVAEYEWICIGEYDDDAKGGQPIKSGHFLRGIVNEASWDGEDNKVPLKEIPPIVISEVLRDLSLVAAKGK